ncbi:MAG: asparagine synthetase B [Candidatus Aenigmatarchaeota archaeon]
MDETQSDHLKSYGLAYSALERGERVEWLLNYRDGSFMLEDSPETRNEAGIRGVTLEGMDAASYASITHEIDENNMDKILLEKAPKIAVYVAPSAEPWDDAVILALDYAEIPYVALWDGDVLDGKLEEFDWLHLHHEDFTGQYGKFLGSYGTAPWYIKQKAVYEELARKAGFAKVSEQKKAVVRAIKEFIAKGGFLFTMCSGTDSFDIALAAEGVDIVPAEYDGDPPDPNCQSKLDYRKCLAFENFKLILDPYVYEFSNIDTSNLPIPRGAGIDVFTLFEFSAKEDPVPTMLTQCHTSKVQNFMGQTTGFSRSCIKKGVTVMAEVEGTEEVKYTHGSYGRGTFTFYGGHDPEDYQHLIGDPPSNLSLHKHSPGYRLILNNILFPAAEKKERKT